MGGRFASRAVHSGTEHLMCLVSAIDDPSSFPARTNDGVGYSAEHLVA